MITASRHLMDNIMCRHAIRSDEKCKISSRKTFFSFAFDRFAALPQCTSEFVSRGTPRSRTSVTLVFGGWRLPRRKERRECGLIEIAGTPSAKRQSNHLCIKKRNGPMTELWGTPFRQRASKESK